MSEHAIDNAKGWLANIVEMVETLQDARKDCAARDNWAAIEGAENAIRESVLSVQVRNGWREPGLTDSDAEEYQILLTTGGPALRIVGDLVDYEPGEWPRLEWQDWGTPWTEYEDARQYRDALRQFAACFWFGE